MTVLSRVCFVVLNAAYIDPAIVSLSSFFKYNDLPVVVYFEKGTVKMGSISCRDSSMGVRRPDS